MRAVILIIVLFVAQGCSDNSVDSNIPYTTFNDIIINLNSQQYLPLKNQGYIAIPGGNKGLILYKNPFTSEYSAYERNCSYQPLDDCAKVEIDDSGLFMIDKCCTSTFNFEYGNPIAGPATFALRQYTTYLDGHFLTITDEPL